MTFFAIYFCRCILCCVYCAGAMWGKHTFLPSCLDFLRVLYSSPMQQFLQWVHGWLSMTAWHLKICSS